METERFEMRAPKDWLAEVDEWRREQPIPPSRAAAIRYLVEAGLKAAEKSSGASRSGGPKRQTAAPDQAAEPSPPKPSPPRKPAPRAKAAAMSKEAQLRALREQGAR
jgi:hypothetical protein